MAQYLVAVDPGADMGVAVFKDGRLASASLGGFALVPGCDVVIECPRIYPRSKADPNDMIVLARKVGRLEEASAQLGLACRLYFPSEWKGTVNGDVMVDRILDHMTTGELGIFSMLRCAPSKQHNVVDAIGLGLFHLGRMKRGGRR